MIHRAFSNTLLPGVAAAALLSGCGFESAPAGETRTETVSYDLDDAKVARVNIRMGGGQLHVTSGTGKLMEGKFAYNIPDWKPTIDYKAGSGEVTLAQPNYSASFGDNVNNWDITLNADVAMELTANLAAGEANLELGRMNLSRVELNIGAGEMIVDLRGEPKHGYSVQVRGGVGETVVYLPRDAAISATATKGIGDISTEGLENRDGVWVNPERIGAPVTVRVDVKGGVGEIRLIR